MPVEVDKSREKGYYELDNMYMLEEIITGKSEIKWNCVDKLTIHFSIIWNGYLQDKNLI